MNGNNTFEQINDILIEMLRDDINEIECIEKLEEDISEKNRFFPKDVDIRDALKCCSQIEPFMLLKGKKLYRARAISRNELNAKTTWMFEKIPGLKDYPCHDNQSYVAYVELFRKRKDQIKSLNINGELDAFFKDDFWGFDKNGSNKPPKEIAKAGRINPGGISYLYAAEDADTAIVESRPIIGQIMSVAEIEVEEDMKLFDFSGDLASKIPCDDKRHLYEAICNRFSIPNYAGDTYYRVTQYITEMLKTQFATKFDGVRFKSSLKRSGINVVLFNTHSKDDGTPLYDIKHTSLHVIDEITIGQTKVLPCS
jgi:hypothetical protein